MERITFQDIPEGMIDRLMSIENFIEESGLSKSLLELIRLRVAQLNGCAYCVDMHHKELQAAGESELRMYSLVVWDETPYFSAKERAVLRFTESLTILEKGGIEDDMYEELAKHFNKRDISFLTLAITQINTWTRITKTFQFTPGNYKVQETPVS